MPTYLLHGFRWPRPLIRIHIVMQNLDDAAPGWLVAPGTTLALLKNFKHLYPECMQHLSRLRFIEQYDPNDSTDDTASQPFAYVADLVEEVKLGVEIDEVRGRGLNNEQWSAIMELRDNLAPEEKVGWYIVVCGDEERPVPISADSMEESATRLSLPKKQSDPSGGIEPVSPSILSKTQSDSLEQPESKSGLKKLMSLRLGRRKRLDS